jgi:hypothetical protein
MINADGRLRIDNYRPLSVNASTKLRRDHVSKIIKFFLFGHFITLHFWLFYFCLSIYYLFIYLFYASTYRLIHLG